MKKLLWLCYALTFLCGCIKETNQPSGDEAENLVTAELAAGDDWVWINNEKMIQVFNPATTSWNGDPIWEWKPEAVKNYSTYAIEKWGNGGTDFKIRTVSRWGGNCFAACSVTGLATIATYPAGMKKWAFSVGNGTHPHSVELLPNGNIAVAASDGNWVKVFASSSSKVDDTTNARFTLIGAHSVLWDPGRSRLWAIGNDHLKALIVGGTNTAPTLREDPAYTVNLNTVASKYGHDISPDLNDADILWISTNHGVYSYNKTTHVVTPAPGALGSKWFVKGISRQNSGIFVVTQADYFKSPFPSGGISDKSHTRWVDFYSANGSFLYSRTRTNAFIYKGKVFRTPY